jgi:geranylgeranyl pyrophosphate synthase
MATEAGPLAPLVALIEADLDARLPKHSALSTPLVAAMRYATLGGGKRIRPLLTCATAASLGADPARALAPACAVEFVHAYSLIHDDLPAMDDDDLRRGRPTTHIAFGEATAILAGDALQALAFETIAQDDSFSSETRLAMTRLLARAAGWAGMVGGQAADMDATGRQLSIDALEAMHRAKTGALLTTSVELGALVVGVEASTHAALRDFGATVGFAFQVVDDLLDVTQASQHIGKTAGADAAAGKNTFPGLLGIDATRKRAARLYEEAVAALGRAGITTGPLHTIAQRIVQRTQ